MSSSRRTVALRVLRQDEFNFDATDDSPLPERPRTRADCVDGPRPCPWIGCRHSLALDIRSDGGITFNEGMTESCSLDVADRGPLTLEHVGPLMALRRERVRQLEVHGMAVLAANGVLRDYSDHRTTTYDEAELWADVSASEVYFEEEAETVDEAELWAERVIWHVEEGASLADAWEKASEEE